MEVYNDEYLDELMSENRRMNAEIERLRGALARIEASKDGFFSPQARTLQRIAADALKHE